MNIKGVLDLGENIVEHDFLITKKSNKIDFTSCIFLLLLNDQVRHKRKIRARLDWESNLGP